MKIWFGQWKVNNKEPSIDCIQKFLSYTEADIIVILQMEYNQKYSTLGELVIKNLDFYNNYHLIVNQQLLGIRLDVTTTDYNGTCLSVLVKKDLMIENIFTHIERSPTKYLSSKGIIVSVLELINVCDSRSTPSKGYLEEDFKSFKLCIIGCNLEVKESGRYLQIINLMTNLQKIKDQYNINNIFIFGDLNNRLRIPKYLKGINDTSINELINIAIKNPDNLLEYDSLYNSDINSFEILRDIFCFPKPYKIINYIKNNIFQPTYKINNTEYIRDNIINKHDNNLLQLGWLDRFGWNKENSKNIKIIHFNIHKDIIYSDHIPISMEIDYLNLFTI